MIRQAITNDKILEKLGKEEIGVVYEAEDAKLKRTLWYGRRENMKKTTLIFLASWILLFQLACSSESQQEQLFIWQNLEKGPYAIGYKVEHIYDYSRTFQEELARPIQITIWYPAVGGKSGRHISYGEYFMNDATEIDFSQNTVEARERSLKKVKDFALGFDAKREAIDSLYAEKILAFQDARQHPGMFPLLLYAPSHSSSPSENAVVFEYLASHGFVIASCPGVGISTRGVKETAPEVESQTRDLEFIRAHMRNFPSVDFNRIGTFGFSWGSIYTILLAMRNSNVGAVASLDGSIGYRRRMEFITGLPGYDPKAMRASYMYISSVPPAGIEDPHDHSFYNDCIYSDAFLIRIPEVHHAYFCSDYLKIYDLMSDEWKEGDDPKRIKNGYQATCRYLRNFFNAVLNGDENSKRFLKNRPEENGIPEGLINVERREGLKPPPTQSQFFTIVEEKDMAEAIRIYREAKDRDPSVKIFDERDMDSMGKQLLKEGNIKKAIAVFQLNEEAYPESARVLESLGDAHLQNGEKNLAADYFIKALKLNPDSHGIKEKLEKLGIQE